MIKKSELMTGDIVVTRTGSLGVVILEKNIILYQNSGYDELDLFTDNMLSDDDCRDCDIMEVYRAPGGAAIGFLDYNDDEPLARRIE